MYLSAAETMTYHRYHSQTLHTLLLGHNNIDVEGGRYLTNALMINKVKDICEHCFTTILISFLQTITTLSVCYNKITPEQIRHLRKSSNIGQVKSTSICFGFVFDRSFSRDWRYKMTNSTWIFSIGTISNRFQSKFREEFLGLNKVLFLQAKVKSSDFNEFSWWCSFNK